MSKKKQDAPTEAVEVRTLTAEEMSLLSAALERHKLLCKDREIILLKINEKRLEKTIKDLELQLLGNTLADKDREISTEKDARAQLTAQIKSKYNIDKPFGYNPDTGAIQEE